MRARLLLAFFGISAFAALAAAAGIYAFREVGDRLVTIEMRARPTLTSLELSRSAERIIAAAPSLLAAPDRQRRDEVRTGIETEVDRLNGILLDLKRDGSDALPLPEIEPIISSLTENLAALEDLVARRLDATERIAVLVRAIFQTNDEAHRLLANWLSVRDSQIAALMGNIEEVGSGDGGARGPELASLIRQRRPAQIAQEWISGIVDMLTEASTTEDTRRLSILAFQLDRELDDLETRAADLDPRLSPLFLEHVTMLREFAAGQNSVIEGRKQELELVEEGEQRLAENANLSAELTAAVNQIAAAAKRDIGDAIDSATSVQRQSTRVLFVLVVSSLLASGLIVWLYVGRNIVRRLTALSDSMLAIAGGRLQTPVMTDGTDEIARMGRAVEVFRRNTLERDELLAEKAQVADRLEQQVEQRTRELAQSVEELRALGEVSQAVNSTLDNDTVLATIVAKATQLSSTEAGAIYVYNDVDQEFRLRATYGMDEAIITAIKDRRIRMGETAIGEAAERGVPMQFPDVQKDASLVLDVIVRAGFRALLIVPLLGADRIVGALVVRRKRPGAFPSATVELLQTFAAQSVLAIQNARLFEEVQSRTRELSQSLDELRTAQDRLVQTEKLASLGQLTAGIAHEIKNPLNFVNNFSSLSTELIDELGETLQGLDINPQVRADVDQLAGLLRGNLERIVQHGQRADSIVKNMLLHSRAGSGEHRLADINALVEESLNLAYHGARAGKQGFNITMEKMLDPEAGEVDLYPQEITRVLLNLISNGFYAATARKANGSDAAYEPTLSVTTRNLGDSVEIRIRDNGTGIPTHLREKLFSPFFTTKPPGEGTGLGLSLSHDIVVKRHAGTIDVDTELDAFTEFKIVLPRGAASLGQQGGPM